MCVLDTQATPATVTAAAGVAAEGDDDDDNDLTRNPRQQLVERTSSASDGDEEQSLHVDPAQDVQDQEVVTLIRDNKKHVQAPQ